MKFWPNFFGSLYAPSTYANARLVHSGWGIRYSLQLLLLTATGALIHLLATTTFTTPTLRDVESIGIIFAGMTLLRAGMLGPLLIACCLLGYLFKLQLTYRQGARITALAYTPAALCDGAAFLMTHHGAPAYLLFGCGVMMLLAALYAAK